VQLTEANIANSRDTTFEQHVMSATGGRGVDLVLNSLAEEKLQASVRCLAYGARFLEIGKLDFSNNNPLGKHKNNLTSQLVLNWRCFVDKKKLNLRVSSLKK